jgi:hypothetical protein
MPITNYDLAAYDDLTACGIFDPVVDYDLAAYDIDLVACGIFDPAAVAAACRGRHGGGAMAVACRCGSCRPVGGAAVAAA